MTREKSWETKTFNTCRMEDEPGKTTEKQEEEKDTGAKGSFQKKGAVNSINFTEKIKD